jgi:uncharacterized protein YndB with AHSA1/START domain
MINMKTDPLIIEKSLNAPVSKVWKAITDNNKMKQWYFDLEEFKPIVGFEFRFYGGTEEKQYLHVCKITEVISGKKLTYSWRYEGYPGESFVSFELFPEEEIASVKSKTRLKLTHTGLESFPVDDPNFAKESFADGWNHIIGKSLKEFVER